MAEQPAGEETDFWLFGYGSLIWKPPPHFDQEFQVTSRATCGGFGSEDHRGTPDAPGRVVTLIQKDFWDTLNDSQVSSDDDLVWGVAYHIKPSKVQEVKEYLDIREINGYSIQFTAFYPGDQSHPDLHCLVYIGMPDNPQFLGALEPQAVAEKINQSIGPSGENREYLLQLDDALRVLSASSHDYHISDLAQRVRAMAPVIRSNKQRRLSESGLQRISSTEEQEEIEKSV